MPNEKEIKEIMAKARKAASGGKAPPEEKPKPEVKPDEKPRVQEKPKEEAKPELPKPSPEIAELKNLIVQQNQNVIQQVANQNERIGKIENFLKEAQRQAQAQMANQTSQTGGDTEDGLTDEQRLAKAQEEQDKKNQAGGGQPSIPKNVPPALAYLYAFNPTFKEIATTVRTAIAKGKVEKEGSESIYETAGKKIMETMLTRFITQQTGGGDNSLEQFKTFLAMQNAVAAGLFSSLKLAGKGQAETILSNLFRETQSPEVPSKALSPSEDHIT